MSGADSGAASGVKTAAIILAAGGSTRLGEAKQLVRIGGETLLERAVRVVQEAGCSPVIVVLGAEAERIRAACALDGCEVVVNRGWRKGMASSIRRGLRAVRRGLRAVRTGAMAVRAAEDAALADARGAVKIEGVVLMTCDQPAVSAEHLRALAAAGEVAASEYAGRRGVPAYFPAAWFRALSDLHGDAGARELLRGARAVALEGGELDVDTAEALEEARRRFE